MKALVLVLAFGLAAIALPGSVDAHSVTCYEDDVPCIVECLLHTLEEEGAPHGCAIRPRPLP